MSKKGYGYLVEGGGNVTEMRFALPPSVGDIQKIGDNEFGVVVGFHMGGTSNGAPLAIVRPAKVHN